MKTTKARVHILQYACFRQISSLSFLWYNCVMSKDQLSGCTNDTKLHWFLFCTGLFSAKDHLFLMSRLSCEKCEVMIEEKTSRA